MMCRIFFVWNVFENSYCDWKQQFKKNNHVDIEESQLDAMPPGNLK